MEGKAMIAHVFDAVRQVEFEQTVVVTGFDSIAQLAVGNGFQAVDNDSPEIGQSHSVVLGVQKTSQSAGWMFFNGDMPWLKSDTIENCWNMRMQHILWCQVWQLSGGSGLFPGAAF